MNEIKKLERQLFTMEVLHSGLRDSIICLGARCEHVSEIEPYKDKKLKTTQYKLEYILSRLDDLEIYVRNDIHAIKKRLNELNQQNKNFE